MNGQGATKASKLTVVPDLKFINRHIAIIEVARHLDSRRGDNGNIHCWRSEFHQNGDRTASVGIRQTNNTVKCFGCGVGPLGVVDFLMAVLGLKNPGDAARWVADRFDVPEISTRKHIVDPDRRIFQYGSQSDIGLLVHSGLWALMSRAW